jgi:hypothetical protein
LILFVLLAGVLCGYQDIQIAGEIFYGLPRRPIRHATLAVRDATNGKTLGKATSDSDGRFNLHVPARGLYSLIVEKDGFVIAEDAKAVASRIPVQDDPVQVAVRMVRAGALAGRLLSPSSAPLEGVEIAALVERQQSGGGSSVARRTRTDDRGIFRLHTLEPGIYYVRATLPGPGNATIYYPGTSTPSQYGRIIMTNQEIVGLNIIVPSELQPAAR